MKTVVLTLVVSFVVAFMVATVGAAAFVWSGWYDISATAQHTQLVYTLLEKTMHQSVKLRAAGIQPPALDAAEFQSRGAQCYRAKCVECHGGPGVAQGDMGRSMQPLPGPLVDASVKWRPEELYWIIRHGIKMSGMPAWKHRLSEQEIWTLVAFMQRLPLLTAVDFAAETHATGERPCGLEPGTADAKAADPVPVASAQQGRAALTQYACSACHLIPGVTGSDVHVGPPLAGFANRSLITGSIPNTPANLVQWIRHPRSIDPLTTMPDLDVGESDARDMAAYLATLK